MNVLLRSRRSRDHLEATKQLVWLSLNGLIA